MTTKAALSLRLSGAEIVCDPLSTFTAAKPWLSSSVIVLEPLIAKEVALSKLITPTIFGESTVTVRGPVNDGFSAVSLKPASISTPLGAPPSQLTSLDQFPFASTAQLLVFEI